MKNMKKCRPSVVGVRRPSPVVVVRRPFRRRRRPLSCPASVRRPSRRRRRPLSVRPVRPSSSSINVGICYVNTYNVIKQMENNEIYQMVAIKIPIKPPFG